MCRIPTTLLVKVMVLPRLVLHRSVAKLACAPWQSKYARPVVIKDEGSSEDGDTVAADATPALC